MKVLDLFSGIGGFSLGLERAGMETVAFCEIDEFCQKVLKKHWPDVPIFNDVRELDYDGSVDLICGGYPCQPFSVAGNRKGEEDDRHLWPAMFSLIKKHRPTWVIGENVVGHVSMGLDSVLDDLESEGYACQTFIIPAVAVDAKHRRDRVWVVGNAEHHGSFTSEKRRKPFEASAHNSEGAIKTCKFKGASRPKSNENVADTAGERQQRQGESIKPKCEKKIKKRQTDDVIASCFQKEWAAEPRLGRVADGVPNRVDRLKSLGNAVVPQIPEIIGRAIMEAHNED